MLRQWGFASNRHHHPRKAIFSSEQAAMATIGDKYILTGSGRSDHDRLRVISEIHDGRTRELLLRAGFAAGQRFVGTEAFTHRGAEARRRPLRSV
jgi:hypothetical protein